MMASSTTMPSAITRPARLMAVNVLSVASMTSTAANSDVGIETRPMSAARQS